MDIYIVDIEFCKLSEKIGIGEESKIVLWFDSDINHIVKSGFDKTRCGICCKSAEDLLKLEIISCLIIKSISWRDDTAAIIEKLRLWRDDLCLGELFDIFDALQFGHFLHTIKLAKMLVDHRSNNVYKFFFTPDKFRIHENIVHGDIVGKLDMFFCFIISEDISSFRFERCFAYMLLIEKIVIIIMLYHLKIE